MTEATQDDSNGALIVVEKANAMTVFKDKSQIELLVGKIRNIATGEVHDATTPAGRAAIRTLANKIRRSKTYLDGIGKELVDELKEVPKLIDASRKAARDQLDALHDEVRQPLTDWEAEQERIKAEEAAKVEAERQRVEHIAANIAAFKQAPLALIGKPYARITEVHADLFGQEPTAADYDDQTDAAHEAWAAAMAQISQIAQQAKALEDQQQAERDRQIAEQATAKEREAGERKIMQAKLDAERAEQERQAAEDRAKAAEREAIEAKANADREREASAERARQAAEQAAQQERDRQEAEQRAAAAEQAKRDADKEHRKTINNKAVNDLTQHAGLTVDQAKAVVLAVFKQQISNITITY